jgi:hypothetical protein
MNLLDLAPHVGITCLVINSALAIVYFLKWRSQRKRANAYATRTDALLADNAGLRAQNVRLTQTVAKLRGEIRTACQMITEFDLKREV